jgi:hypothetical protein
VFPRRFAPDHGEQMLASRGCRRLGFGQPLHRFALGLRDLTHGC